MDKGTFFLNIFHLLAPASVSLFQSHHQLPRAADDDFEI